ncbi:hypothetical protein M3629_28055, partial [Paenibacillus polysaccharolyticus]|uniref:RCC1 domain-containing protein n=1 Tax=Paenibacillus polysaccharolyticus TaxID=582692 RepID=UPI002A329CCE|nr:hypothetical protein [Paenibacillus polysaccharolyticus]
MNQKVQVRVRVKDQQLWSDWSKAGWLKVDPNGQPETQKKLSSGGDFTLTVKEDGTVWSWGNNGYGQLGDGTRSAKTVAVQASGLTSIVEVSAGSGHVLALKSDGTVWSWGNNAQSQLGDGTTVAQNVAKVIPKLSEMISIGAVQNRSYAVKADGTLWAWGGNFGATPQPMKINGVVSVTGRYALLSDGTVWDVSSSYPTKVYSLENVVTIADSSSSGHALAIKRDGSVWSWGSNSYGQLGNGTTSNTSTPVKVTGLENIQSIGAGAMHSLAVDELGQVWSWGYNGYGQLGVPGSSSVTKAVQVGNMNRGAQIVGGTNSSTVLLRNGDLWSWGQGGLLGDGTTTSKGVP